MTAIDWPDCRNARDLGGLPTMDGHRIRPGALFRADGLFRLTPAGIEAVRAAGVTRILDLRWTWECERHPSPFAGDDALHHHVPLLEDELTYEVDPATYGPMLDHNGPRIAAAFTALAAAPAGGVLVHCHGGRDRTGALIALALSIAGVPHEEIIADYARTPAAQAPAMANTLNHVDERYGGTTSYLHHIGITQNQADAVRHRLLDDAAG